VPYLQLNDVELPNNDVNAATDVDVSSCSRDTSVSDSHYYLCAICHHQLVDDPRLLRQQPISLHNFRGLGEVSWLNIN
jgi:hypothetical protein